MVKRDDGTIGILQLEQRVHVVQRELAHGNEVHSANGAGIELGQLSQQFWKRC